jgi:TM2 domain-containing membrane protein YozV
VLHSLGRTADARDQYRSLLERDGSLAGVERKIARVALEIDAQSQERLAVEEALNKPENTAAMRRSAGMALALSVVAPGVGQIYCGEIGKGIIVLGSFLLSTMIIAFSSGTATFVKQLFNVISGGANGGTSSQWPSNWLLLSLGVGVFAYIYGVVDAPVSAMKRERAANKSSAETRPETPHST